ncbi:TPA: ATP synthase F0 subunit B [bacterium]|nr:ATP synthase F0 subunit B [bacterium]
MIEISGWIILVQLISFLVLMAVLTKFLFVPLSRFIESRKEKIGSTLSLIKEEEFRIARMEDEAGQRLKRIEEEGSLIIEKAKKQAEEEGRMIINKAVKEARDETSIVIEDAKIEIEKAKQDALIYISDISCAIAEKLIKKEIDEKKHDELFLEFANSISKKEVLD